MWGGGGGGGSCEIWLAKHLEINIFKNLHHFRSLANVDNAYQMGKPQIDTLHVLITEQLIEYNKLFPMPSV